LKSSIFSDGHNGILNYVGGEPFPHPAEPDKGYKLLADLWFAYVPHLLVGTSANPLTICSETSHGFVSCERLSYVFRQVAYNTDGEASAEELKGSDYWYTEWTSVEEPEELRYNTYYGLEYGSRILMLTADRGLGKTTLLRHFERRMHDHSHTLFLSPSRDNGREVLCKLLVEIGGTTASDDLHTIRVQVDKLLTGVAGADNPFILLLDYDENDAESALETLRYLTTLESFERRLLRVIIASSPDIAEKLQGSAIADEVRRIPLAPLPVAEVESYIDYRLRMVGWRGGRLFTAKACTLIAERSSTKPSAINEICSNLLQNLAEQESSHSDSAARNQDFVLDEAYVDFIISGRKPSIPTPAHSLSLRTAALACILLMLVLAMAGLWYRSAMKARTAKHVTAEIVVPVAPSRHSTIFHNEHLKQLPNLAHAVTGAGAASKGVASTATEAAASKPARNMETAGLSHVATPAVSAVSSPTPVKATFNTAAVHLTSTVPPILSPAAAVLNNEGNQPAEAVAKDHKVITAPFSRIVVPSQTPASSPARQQTTETHAAAVRRVAVATEGDGATRTANEMAAYEIRLGDAYMNAGDYDKALGSFSRAIAFTPDNKKAVEKIQRARRAKAAEEDVLQ
jgi:type II secretory pathway predicted ATPase ExeA